MTDAVFRRWVEDGLVWLPEKGMGWYPVQDSETKYDDAYFAKYVAYARTELGQRLNIQRCGLVESYVTNGTLLDVGIGCGSFISALIERAPRSSRLAVYGYDVNPVAVKWLRERGLYHELLGYVDYATFWDSIEHIPIPGNFLHFVRRGVFVSLPIFTGPDHVLRSKHFRRDEHTWYWTRDGFIGWMREYGFRCVEHNTAESIAGREDIHTFVFEREP